MKYISRILLAGALFFSFSSLSWGQGIGISSSGVDVELRPRVVQPLTPVSMELSSFSTDLNRARISLYVDGALITQELGKTQFSVDAPAVGQSKDVRFVIETRDQGTVTKTLTISPAQVDLVAEAASSYTPTLYQGRKLPADGAPVRVVAIPYFVDASGRKIDPDSLVYSWFVADSKQVNASGYGKQVFNFPGSALYRTKTVAVEVETVDGDLLARRSIELPAYDPVIRFYKKSPLWGIDLSEAITADASFVLNVPELEVVSVPYFFSGDQSSLTYDWRMNGSPMQTFGDNNLINLRAPDNQSGRARISLKATNQNQILQIAESVFTVVFGDPGAPRRGSTTNSSNDSSGGFNFFGTGN